MKAAAMPYFIARVVPIAVFSILLSNAAPLFSGQSDSSSDLGKIKRKAASQHEYIMLLIGKKEYVQAEKEACKIFQMKWPAGQESLLLTELLILSDQFRSHGQPTIGLHLIDHNEQSFKQIASQIAILKEKALLYKSLNQDDKALEYFHKAEELEDKSENKK